MVPAASRHSPLPTVFVVDDEPAVRKALARVLRAMDIKVAQFGSAEEFIAAHDPAAPGCLLLDVAMPGLNGLELQRTLAVRDGALPIIFLSGCAEVPISVQAMKAGAVDFLTKPVPDEVLLAAVRAAFRKDRVARSARTAVAAIEARLATLTPREREVLDHVVAGQLNKQIADDLGAAEQTIKIHRGRMMGKMKVQSVAELVRLIEHLRISAPKAHRTKVS
ncbi:MAG: response regulator [Verrucomicrobia bacterium]|nr:response regulator [Verrucomicrobiota bacterium]